MKCEAIGNLVADASLVERLKIGGMSTLQSKIASALWMVKPVQPCEAGLLSTHVPIVSKSRSVTAISSSPPNQRYNFVRGSNQFCRTSVEKYMNRPTASQNKEVDEATFYE